MTSGEELLPPIGEETLSEIESLARQLFENDDVDLDTPILGETNNDIVAPNIHEMLRDPNNILATLSEDDRLVGFSIAVPMGIMDPTREEESSETAYIYFTGIDPNRQREKLVGKLMEDMHAKLRARGFSFIERDCVLAQGYADSVERAYQGAIVRKYNHAKWKEVGPQRFFRIDLSMVN